MPTSLFMPMDGRSGSRKVVELEHAKMHAGLMWTGTHTNSVGTATAVTILFTAPSTNPHHLSFDIESSNTLAWTFSEAPNASGGTPVTSYNRDRSSTNANTLTVAHTATYVSSGTILENHYDSTMNTGRIVGMGGASWSEWILASGQSYLLRCVASNAGTIVSINYSVYRET